MPSHDIPAQPDPANLSGLTPNASGLYVPPAGIIDPTAQALGGNIVTEAEAEAAQLAILTLMRIVQARAQQRAAEATTDAADAATPAPKAPALDAGLPTGYSLVRHSTNDPREHHGPLDPKKGVLDIPDDATKAGAVAINITNTATGLQMGPKFGMEYNALDEKGNYRTLVRRIDTDTNKPVFVDEGPAIIELAKSVPSVQAITREDKKTIKHVQHAAAEAMILFGKAARIESILAPVINARNMISRANAKFIIEPDRLDEVMAAKVYTSKGKYVGQTTDPEKLAEQFSLVELGEKDTRIAGSIRVFDKAGKYVGQTTDPEIAKTLRGYEELDVPLRTRQYLMTDMTRAERNVTQRQLNEFLEFARQANHHRHEARHHAKHSHLVERPLPTVAEAREEAIETNKRLFETAVPPALDFFKSYLQSDQDPDTMDRLAAKQTGVPILGEAIAAEAEVKRVRAVQNLNDTWEASRQAVVDTHPRKRERKMLFEAEAATQAGNLEAIQEMLKEHKMSTELRGALIASSRYIMGSRKARVSRQPHHH